MNPEQMDNYLKWTLIYFGISSLIFLGTWIIGYLRNK